VLLSALAPACSPLSMPVRCLPGEVMRVSKFGFAVIILLASIFLSAAPLRADGTDNYVYTADGNTFTWQLSADPSPKSSDPIDGFTFSNFTLKENGHSVTGTLDFYTSLLAGGFDFWTGSLTGPDFVIDAYGPQLFGGSTGLPTMLAGNFSFEDFAANDNNALECSYSGSLQVTATPEPSALLLLFVGLVTALGLTALRKN
jgi:hypothetical protein